MFQAKYIFLVLVLVISGVMTLDANAQAASTVAKLAKDFKVSPKLLTKFSKAGLSGVDLGNGLKIAKDVADVKSLQMNDAAEQVLNLKQGGKDWSDIAQEFGIELPQGIDKAIN